MLGCSGGIGGALRTTSFLVDDDILIDADVREELDAGTDRVHDQHEPEQWRGQEPRQHDVVHEAHELDQGERSGRPAQPLNHLARNLPDHDSTRDRILMDRRGIARLHLVK